MKILTQRFTVPDNHPIVYQVSSCTTEGLTAGWHLVEIKMEMLEKEILTIPYIGLGDLIKNLQDIEKFLIENGDIKVECKGQ